MTATQAKRARDAAARVGTVLHGKYRIERVIGIGGTASVFAAQHRNGFAVAVKMLHAEHARVFEIRTRFLREGYVANKIKHSGVVTVMDDDIDDEGAVFLVMELLAGATLESLWETQKEALPVKDVLLYSDHLLDVLAAAHEAGVVHRDIKPDNIFLTTDDRIKVFDFGIARLLDGTGATQSGQIFGTPAFMAPEQASGRSNEVGPRTDLWSVGATMFTLISGQLVHKEIESSFIHAAISPARSLGAVAPHLPIQIVDLVDTALAFRPDKRWSSASAMQAALRAVAR